MSHGKDASTAFDESELAATSTPGYRPGQQKTLEELNALDAEDESLQKYKAALLGGSGAASGSGGKPGVSGAPWLCLSGRCHTRVAETDEQQG